MAFGASSGFEKFCGSPIWVRMNMLAELGWKTLADSSLNVFKNRLDNHWINQDVMYDWHADISGVLVQKATASYYIKTAYYN